MAVESHSPDIETIDDLAWRASSLFSFAFIADSYMDLLPQIYSLSPTGEAAQYTPMTMHHSNSTFEASPPLCSGQVRLHQLVATLGRVSHDTAAFRADVCL